MNSLGLALLGMGLNDDNAGKLIVPLSLGLPFTIRSGAGSPQAKGVGSSGSYTVPAGKLLYLHTVYSPGGVSLTVDPADAASWTIALAATNTGLLQGGLCLGAGDLVTMPGNAYASGLLVDTSALVGSPTRVIKELNSTTAYTVGAGKLLLVTHLQPNSASTVDINLDGSTVMRIAQQLQANGGWVSPRLLLAAGQQLAAAGATNFTMSGIEYAV